MSILVITVIVMNLLCIAVIWYRLARLESNMIGASSTALKQHNEIMHLTRAVGAISLQVKEVVIPKPTDS